MPPILALLALIDDQGPAAGVFWLLGFLSMA
jgi:hypothetical protein